MTDAVTEFIERARGVSIAEAAPRLGLTETRGRHEHPQPCPLCGGKDRFSYNTAKNVWNCRGGDVGGRDAIGMAAHVATLNLNDKAEFLEACALVLGEAVPDQGERMTPEARAARAQAIEARRRENERAAENRERDANVWRDRERRRARGIWEHARPIDGSVALRYLQRRLAVDADFAARLHVRHDPALTYWHGKDERDNPVDIHQGPAMIGAFEDAESAVIGAHLTWIDLARRPKFRPDLGLDQDGRALPTKKMRGSKKGGLIPVAGDRDGERQLVGEGIETVVAVAVAEGFRADTFYVAAGDKGNLAGPGLQTGRTKHPHLTRTDRKGRERPVMLPSPFPDPDRLGDGVPIAAHRRECVFLGENDMDRYELAALLARARARAEILAPDCVVSIAWPLPSYGDFCDMMAGQRMVAA